MGSDLERALALHRANRLDEAAWAYATILACTPNDFEAGYYLSLLRAAQGDVRAALMIAQEALAGNPGDHRAHAHLGALLAASQQPEQAIEHLRRALEDDPNQPEVLNNLGAALRSVGRLDQALPYFEQALKADPRYVDALGNLRAAAFAAGGYAAAIAALERVIASGAHSALIYDELGTQCWKYGHVYTGITWYERALELDADFVDARARLGNAFVEVGRLQEARACFLDALARAPQSAKLYRFLAETDPSAVNAEHLAQLEMLSRAPQDPADSADTQFALGKVFAARGEVQRAFEHLVAANASWRTLVQYDEGQTLRAFTEIERVFSAEMLEQRVSGGHPSTTPVFIFGMPRSGTSLVEQILASHPHIHGAGELELFAKLADTVLAGGAQVTPDDMLRADAAMLRHLGYRYVEVLRNLAPPISLRITDKMPSNFQYVGLIRSALPNAKLIHVRRDPLDTCLSCFSHTFAGEGLGWTYNLAELGRYYRAYSGLMNHWRAVLPPGAMLEVQYEDLVDDFETQARRLVEYCGLPWDERCSRFYETKRPVRTASATQVRRPLYRSSVGKARRYGELLRPLVDALELTA